MGGVERERDDYRVSRHHHQNDLWVGGGLKINRPHVHAHDSRTNHSHEHRASNGATTLKRVQGGGKGKDTSESAREEKKGGEWCKERGGRKRELVEAVIRST